MPSPRPAAQESQGTLSPFLARQRYEHAARYVSKNDTVLDLGCGSGELRKYLPAGTAYFGTDIAKHWPSSEKDLFVVKVGGTLPAALRKKKITVVTALALIEHLAEPGTLFVDARNALTPAGRFVLTTPHPIGRAPHDLGGKLGIFSSDASEEHETFLGKRDLARLAERNGFEMTDYKRFLFGMNQVAVFTRTGR